MFQKLKRKIYNFTHPVVGEILMLHRVIEKRSEISINRDIEVTPQFLDNLILQYKEKKYDFVSIDEALNRINSNSFINNRSPFVCFTFDDGYIDNYTNAYPIFKKYNCPFTIYITTDFYEYKAFLWWYILEQIVISNDSVQLSNGKIYDTSNRELKDKAFIDIHNMLSKINPLSLKSEFSDLFQRYSWNELQLIMELSMSPEQIYEISKDPLCTIGAHSVSHPYLSNLNSQQQRAEIQKSIEKLSKLTHSNVSHFAYPFGDHDANCISALSELKVSSAVIAWGAYVRKGCNLYKVPRSFIKQSV